MRNFKQKIAGGSALALAACLVAGAAQADIVHADDVIINGNGGGSLCVGFDCVNGESFGSDTIRLKENNVRIHFDDSSNTGSFPYVDWRLIANDNGNGGRNIFILQDVTNNKFPFAVEANAPTNLLYLDSNGRLGVKTETPAVDVHIKQGNTPAVRLDQDQSSGFDSQVWDVAGNEVNFFVRDVTHTSHLPFRIKAGAGNDDGIVIDRDGEVGFGTDNPNGSLEIVRDSIPHIRLNDRSDNVSWTWQVQDTETRLATQAGPGIEFALTTLGEIKIPGPLTLTQAGPAWTALNDTSTGIVWNYQNNGGEARITTQANPGIEFALATNGNLTILGEIFTAGSCAAGCDRVFDADYDLRSIREHAKLMWTNGYLPAVGPTAEEGSMNLSQKVGGMLNELEHAHIYIAELEERVAKLEQRSATAQ